MYQADEHSDKIRPGRPDTQPKTTGMHKDQDQEDEYICGCLSLHVSLFQMN